MYELIKTLKVAGENGFLINQLNKLAIKIYSSLSHINIHYYLKHRITIMRRQFFRKVSQNPEYVQTHCSDRKNPFHFACRKWFLYLYNIPQCLYKKV